VGTGVGASVGVGVGALVGAFVGAGDKHPILYPRATGFSSLEYWPAGQGWQQPNSMEFAEVSSPAPWFPSIFILKPQIYAPDGHGDWLLNDPHPQLHP
jgi:hypothetical protein